MKRLQKLLAILLTVCVLFAIPANVFAASNSSQDGLEVIIETDKDEYGANDEITVTVTLKNTNSHKLEGISVETLLPEGLHWQTSGLTLANIDLEAGESHTVTFVAVLSEELRGDEETEPPATSVPESATPETGTPETSTNKADKKNNIKDILVWTAIGVGCLVALIVIIVLIKHKKGKHALSLLLSLSMLVPLLPISSVKAETIPEEKTPTVITVEKTVTVDGIEYTITAKVTKLSEAEPEKQDNARKVTFSLNDESNCAYSVLMVEDGKSVSEPISPERLGYTFIGWYTEAACTNKYDFNTAVAADMTVYAGWEAAENGDDLSGSASGGGTEYAITGIEMDGSCVRTIVNVNAACTLRVQFFNEITNGLITTVETQTPDYCELTPISIMVNATLPEKFVIVAYLFDAEGNKLCNQFTCLDYTTAYEEYSNLTVGDFEGDTVLSFDAQQDNNFGVLCDDVIIITIGTEVNKFSVSPRFVIPENYDGTQELETVDDLVFENPDETVKNLKAGDKIYVGGTQHLIKIGSVATYDDGKIVFSPASGVALFDFYKFLKVDMTIENNDETDDSGVAPMKEWVDETGKTTLGGSFEVKLPKNLIFSGELSAEASVSLKIVYDVYWFSKDYWYISVKYSHGLNLDASLKVTVNNEESEDKYRYTFGKARIPTGVPGLDITAHAAVVLEWELNGGVTVEYESNTTTGFIYGSDGMQKIDDKGSTVKIGAEGEATLTVGPEVSIGLSWCVDAVKVTLTAGAGVEVNAKAEIKGSLSSEESIHACALCLSGTLKWYVKAEASFSYNIMGFVKGNFAKWEIVNVKGNFPISPNFFMSLVNDKDSVLLGNIVFGWGECPNKSYRTEITVKDANGKELTGIDVVINKKGGTKVTNGKSKLRAYLYAGSYEASCTVNGEKIKQTFDVNYSAVNITLKATKQSKPETTKPVTTAPVTTAPVTTKPVTTAPVTTSPVTTKPVTTAPETTMPDVEEPDDSEETVPEIELTAKDGESANGFLWEHNYSEITITGYEGASNDLVIPSKINGKPVTLIKREAFVGFTGLKSVKIPGTIKRIDSAFIGCTSLESVKLGDGIESMAYAFYGCSALKSVSVPGSVHSMPSAFENCESLTSVTLAEGVIDLSSAFESCSSLESVHIPSTVTNMNRTFARCSSLKYVTFSEQISITYLYQTFSACSSLETIVIPETVTSISGVFQYCTALNSISIHEGIEDIEYAFIGCTSLEEIQIPTSVLDGYRAFEGCTSLKKVSTFGEANTEEMSYSQMFSGCTALEEIDLTGLSGLWDFSLESLVSLKKLTFDEQIYLDLFEWSDLPVESSVKIVDTAPDNVYDILMNTNISRGYSYSGTITIDGLEYDLVVKDGYGMNVKGYSFEEIIDNGRGKLNTYYSLGAIGTIKEVICRTYKYELVVAIEVYPMVDEWGDYICDDEGYYIYPELKYQEIEINGVVYPLE